MKLSNEERDAIVGALYKIRKIVPPAFVIPEQTENEMRNWVNQWYKLPEVFRDLISGDWSRDTLEERKNLLSSVVEKNLDDQEDQWESENPNHDPSISALRNEVILVAAKVKTIDEVVSHFNL